MTKKEVTHRIIDTELVSGHCEECGMYTILVGLGDAFYRCTNCGFDVEQKINGVIKYMKVDKNTQLRLRDLDEKDG